jgi:hypothetical protein
MARWLRRISVSWGFGYLISAMTHVVYSIGPVSCDSGTRLTTPTLWTGVNGWDNTPSGSKRARQIKESMV